MKEKLEGRIISNDSRDAIDKLQTQTSSSTTGYPAYGRPSVDLPRTSATGRPSHESTTCTQYSRDFTPPPAPSPASFRYPLTAAPRPPPMWGSPSGQGQAYEQEESLYGSDEGPYHPGESFRLTPSLTHGGGGHRPSDSYSTTHTAGSGSTTTHRSTPAFIDPQNMLPFGYPPHMPVSQGSDADSDSYLASQFSHMRMDSRSSAGHGNYPGNPQGEQPTSPLRHGAPPSAGSSHAGMGLAQHQVYHGGAPSQGTPEYHPRPGPSNASVVPAGPGPSYLGPPSAHGSYNTGPPLNAMMQGSSGTLDPHGSHNGGSGQGSSLRRY
ncbi:hypothetical protein DXG03_000972 [Asterophora parasitica]|uniref:Uncharacterized protein n=1 Tax=Asterophora parasitica TaxID=117018 RepID=A0A9P7KBT4_9AGAR|nr:hypothetical protein DXG03_000972 [Asterophora parasitica]